MGPNSMQHEYKSLWGSFQCKGPQAGMTRKNPMGFCLRVLSESTPTVKLGHTNRTTRDGGSPLLHNPSASEPPKSKNDEKEKDEKGSYVLFLHVATF